MVRVNQTCGAVQNSKPELTVRKVRNLSRTQSGEPMSAEPQLAVQACNGVNRVQRGVNLGDGAKTVR